MKKKLVINSASCDVRNAVEENYSQYENITIHAASVVTNQSGKAFLNKMPITLECANMIETEENVRLSVINGRIEIKSTDKIPSERIILMVNGSVAIGANTENYLKQCAAIIVNGSVLYPESMSSYLNHMTVNGKSACHPDDAIILKKNAVVDRLFSLRAKNALYWSSKRMIMVDPKLNAQELKEKGASFSCNEVIISESKVEEFLSLIDERAEFVIVPDGTSVAEGNIVLDEAAVRKYGKKLYVIGDVTVPFEKDCLDSLEYLSINGDAIVPKERSEKFSDMLEKITGDINIISSKTGCICDRQYIRVTKWMLEQSELDISDCMIAELDSDIDKELIMERLKIKDCCMVKCSKEQSDAIAMICKDVGEIKILQQDSMEFSESDMQSQIAELANNSDTKVINAISYVM